SFLFSLPFLSLLCDGKPGMCPVDHFKCRQKLPGECATDYQCFWMMKCCFLSCRFRCLNPGEGKIVPPCTMVRLRQHWERAL
uniref:WAP domain-containing protein n=1 Tax=Sarcophilus harrisii TaxID=9305 RepID=A0A7N4V5E1_SARHA